MALVRPKFARELDAVPDMIGVGAVFSDMLNLEGHCASWVLNAQRQRQLCLSRTCRCCLATPRCPSAYASGGCVQLQSKGLVTAPGSWPRFDSKLSGYTRTTQVSGVPSVMIKRAHVSGVPSVMIKTALCISVVNYHKLPYTTMGFMPRSDSCHQIHADSRGSKPSFRLPKP